MSENDKSLIELEENESIGEVKIADEVVATIAAIAATEVAGVDSVAGNMTNEMLGKLGIDSATIYNFVHWKKAEGNPDYATMPA